MSYELQGRVEEIFETKVISDKFKKREFVVVTDGKYPDHVKFELTQDNCDKIEGFKVNDLVNVKFNIRGNKWTKEEKTSYFTSVQAWGIFAVGGQAVSSGTPITDEDLGINQPANVDETDTLPF